jgi:hypothetical protein
MATFKRDLEEGEIVNAKDLEIVHEDYMIIQFSQIDDCAECDEKLTTLLFTRTPTGEMAATFAVKVNGKWFPDPEELKKLSIN